MTMDAWSEDQLKKMQASGNGKMNTFFKAYGVAKEVGIKEKYAGQVAEVCHVSIVHRLDFLRGDPHPMLRYLAC